MRYTVTILPRQWDGQWNENTPVMARYCNINSASMMMLVKQKLPSTTILIETYEKATNDPSLS